MPTFTISLYDDAVAAIQYIEPGTPVATLLQRNCENLARSAIGRRFNAIVDKIAQAQPLTLAERALVDERLALVPTKEV